MSCSLKCPTICCQLAIDKGSSLQVVSKVMGIRQPQRLRVTMDESGMMIQLGKQEKRFGACASEYNYLLYSEYCRETVERLMQLELMLNGVEGIGYNSRFKIPTKDEKKEWLQNIVKDAIFGGKTYKYEIEFQMFLDTGIMPTSVPIHFRRRADFMDIEMMFQM